MKLQQFKTKAQPILYIPPILIRKNTVFYINGSKTDSLYKKIFFVIVFVYQSNLLIISSKTLKFI